MRYLKFGQNELIFGTDESFIGNVTGVVFCIFSFSIVQLHVLPIACSQSQPVAKFAKMIQISLKVAGPTQTRQSNELQIAACLWAHAHEQY